VTVEDAIRKVDDVIAPEYRQKNEPGSFTILYRLGPVTVDAGGIQRGVISCSHCGETTGMGTIIVSHDDGRTVHFHPQLFHYAQAGHPITDEDVDRNVLVAIMADV
jgi:hypothetical protein